MPKTPRRTTGRKRAKRGPRISSLAKELQGELKTTERDLKKKLTASGLTAEGREILKLKLEVLRDAGEPLKALARCGEFSGI